MMFHRYLKNAWWIRAIILTALSLSFALAVGVGFSLGQRSMVQPLQQSVFKAQAVIYFNNIMDDEKLNEMLKLECYDTVLNKINFMQQRDMTVLTELNNNGHLTDDVKQYIKARRPNFLSGLSTFKIKYGERWKIKQCHSTDATKQN